ncbi:hypothetical protein [Agromyces humatus]|uniref:Uncharacterized protein n=1 Tax=Agromyces humatus TaxID=279573 RepID=A0ABN2KJY1_9MICO|nr:hypothetical protein [Agromyces humatus]
MPHHTKHFVARALIVAAATLGIVFVQAAPASATVHEIVGQWCSGQDELAPPGITGGSKADNFAKPLFASGFISEDLVPFTGDAGPGLLIEFNYDNPNSKVVGTGVFVIIDPSVPIYLELIEPDPNFPAFKACPKLATG